MLHSADSLENWENDSETYRVPWLGAGLQPNNADNAKNSDDRDTENFCNYPRL